MSDATAPETPLAASPAEALFAVSLLLSTPDGHAAGAAIANEAGDALAVALRTADRDRPGEVLSGSVAAIPPATLSAALIRWLLIADPVALKTLSEDLLHAMPIDAVRDALTVLQEAVESTETLRQSRRRGKRRL